MKSGRRYRRGQPVLAMIVLLIGWSFGRTIFWQSPFPELVAPVVAAGLATASPVATIAADKDMSSAHDTLIRQLLPGQTLPFHRPGQVERQKPTERILVKAQVEAVPRRALAFPAMIGPGRTLLPHASGIAAGVAAPVPAGVIWPEGDGGEDRWSVSSWALWREGSRALPSTGAAAPRYGASQAGAVLQYNLAPHSDFRPAAHMRVTRALLPGGETELALGANLRPIPQLPARLHAEARAIRQGGDLQVRPSAFLTTEIAPQNLPGGTTGRVYLQAGYVGGSFATPFVDGQVGVDREIAGFDLAAVELGAGAWGGAQEGAARLDIGPALTLAARGTRLPLRLSVDYRIRVAGDAAPATGVAVTVSTGF